MSTTLTLAIELDRSNPSVMRRVEIPANLTFLQLHDVIQAAMGWADEHLFEFKVGPWTISMPDDDFVPSTTQWDASRHTLLEMHLTAHDTFSYLYDFGDNWQHTLTVVDLSSASIKRPRVISGSGACPPEDVGGLHGYYEFLRAWEDPSHPEHAEYRQWAQGRYEPEFNLIAADARVSKLASAP
ncbi:MAG: hypothetical protein C7B45_13070 [Sulfobacillus acidophilus]|uniref:Plasmid pRiA4b Orf3-like domain-containing protein n=1 Tax=Sulfobacillus acidophilus TaxID=53633 RepID=A0A2T2WF84_9FIRM|nr:MAG: hypothetical protein C7B45_13070 [Sulfobacillus acidophilus]